MNKFEANDYYMPNEPNESINTDFPFNNNCYIPSNHFNADQNINKLTNETPTTSSSLYEDETVNIQA